MKLVHFMFKMHFRRSDSIWIYRVKCRNLKSADLHSDHECRSLEKITQPDKVMKKAFDIITLIL